MFHVGYAGHLDAKVVGNKAEGDVTPHVMTQSRHVLTLIVASDGKVFLEEFVCKDGACESPYVPLQILTYTHPLASTILLRFYLLMISWGRMSCHRCMYS